MNKSIDEKIQTKNSLEEFKQISEELYKDLLNDINEDNLELLDNKLKELSSEELDILFEHDLNYKSLGSASSKKFVAASVSNLTEDYYKKLLTTALIGFLYQMKTEYIIDVKNLVANINESDFLEEDPLSVNTNINDHSIYSKFLVETFSKKYPNDEKEYIANSKLRNDIDNSYKREYKDMESMLTEDELLNINLLTSNKIKELATPRKTVNKDKMHNYVQTQLEEQSVSERKIIENFLDNIFKFNPLNHLKSAVNKIEGVDEDRKLNSNPQTELEKILYEKELPNDTYCRFTSFYEVNYDKLRETTNNLYNVKPDLDFALIVYDIFNSTEEVEKFVHKYGTQSKLSILSFPLNKWALLGPFSKNRERIDYYSKHNNILKSMLEQTEKDNELSTDIMKNRIKKNKEYNTTIFGPDSKEFLQYKNMNPSELETKYDVKVKDLEDGNIEVTRPIITDSNTGKTLKLDGDGIPDNAIEVPIININAKTGKTSKTRIFTKSE
jgi:hypothetical protein